MKTANAKKQKQAVPTNEPTLSLTMDQYQRLEQVWYAIGELSLILPAPENEDGGVACLKIINDKLGDVVQELQEQREKLKGVPSVH